jgi:hypothetical protein
MPPYQLLSKGLILWFNQLYFIMNWSLTHGLWICPSSKDPNTIVIKVIMPVIVVTFLITMVVFFLYWSAWKEKNSLLLQIQEGNMKWFKLFQLILLNTFSYSWAYNMKKINLVKFINRLNVFFCMFNYYIMG